ncbi:homoserine kinase [Aeropyrum pernix]|uniref:Homoserine kinase n=1 Tax=Aeropyrum pernix TaxID=56636 RepID=A0A401H7Z4_AERPX|nr:homoserine kinase [Aeropyrum pernix]GBF08429.1 homoserine kinase [Aeropyrum pernix]
MACSRARARAYSSAANLGPGFDALAVALDAYYDEVEVRVCGGGTSVYVDEVEGKFSSGVLQGPNTAAEAVRELLNMEGVEAEVGIRVYKGVPPGRGLGSSGASAAAAVVAVSHALALDVPVDRLVLYAGLGERAAAGQSHFDNAAASILGGLAVVASDAAGKLRVFRVPFKAWFAVVTPMNPVPQGKTGVMRKVLPENISFRDAVRNFSRAAGIVAAAVNGDLESMGALMMSDEIVEPRRRSYVPCYTQVRKAALHAGALGFSLSGAGPSMIALAPSSEAAREIAAAMEESCICCDNPMTVVAEPAPGASVVG